MLILILNTISKIQKALGAAAVAIVIFSLFFAAAGCDAQDGPTELAIAIAYDPTASSAYSHEEAETFLHDIISKLPKGSSVALFRVDALPDLVREGHKKDVQQILNYWPQVIKTKLVGTDQAVAFDKILDWFEEPAQKDAKRKILVEWSDLRAENYREGAKVLKRVASIDNYAWEDARGLSLEAYFLGVPFERKSVLRNSWKDRFITPPVFFDPRHLLTLDDLKIKARSWF